MAVFVEAPTGTFDAEKEMRKLFYFITGRAITTLPPAAAIAAVLGLWRLRLFLTLVTAGIWAVASIGVEQTIIMFCVLVIAFGQDSVPGRGGIPGQGQIFFPDLMHISPHLGVGTVAVYDLISGRRTAFAGATPAS